MSKKEELLWLADEFSKHAPGPFLKVWVWFPSTDVSGLADVINTWTGPLKIFGLPIPARLLGVQAEGNVWVRANCCLAWEGGLLEELFSRASKIISNGQDGRFELWASVFVQEALESASPLLSFSKGPFVWAGQTEYDFRMVLDLRTQKNPDFPLPGLKEKLEALSVPWVLYAEHKSPFLASAALCRQLAQQEEAPASGSPAACGGDSSDRPKQAETKFVFRRDGDGWYIQAFGQQGHFRNLKGFECIARLLQNPGTPIPISRLAGTWERTGRPSGILEGHIGLSVQSHHVQDVLVDQEGIEDYRREIADYQEQIAEAETMGDSTTAEVLRNELNALLKHRNQVVGLWGKRRYFQGEIDKARIGITNVLRYAYKKLREGNMEHLANHLEVAISFQVVGFVYEPTPGVSWEVKD